VGCFEVARAFRDAVAGGERPGAGRPQSSILNCGDESSYQVAQSLGFNGDFRAWEHLLRIHLANTYRIQCVFVHFQTRPRAKSLESEIATTPVLMRIFRTISTAHRAGIEPATIG
jgi:hypothetical protein